MRRAATIACAAVALALAACGSDSAPSDVESTARAYLLSFATGNPAKACSLLTPSAQRRFVAQVRAIAPATGCADAVRQIRTAAGPVAMGALARSTVSQVKVNDDHATAKLTSGSGSQVARLVRTGDSWRLTAAPGTQ